MLWPSPWPRPHPYQANPLKQDTLEPQALENLDKANTGKEKSLQGHPKRDT
jgi:hypothetical protein